MTLKCSKGCPDSFILSVFKGCRRCALVRVCVCVLKLLALLKAGLLTQEKELLHFHQNYRCSEVAVCIDIQETPCLKQQDIKF